MKLTDAVKGYLLSRRAKCNDRTIEWYRQKLAHFCAVLQQEYEVTRLEKVTVTHLRLFVEHMKLTKSTENHPYKPKGSDDNISDLTVKGYVQAIKGFFNWCEREELLKKNPASKLDNPKVGRYVIKTFSSEQIKAMLDVCDTRTPTGYRDYMIILLLLDTGIRLSELCGLTLDRVYLGVKDQAFIKVMGKGRKEREVGLSVEVAECLWKYINVYRKPKNTAERTLLISIHGQVLTLFGVEQMLQEIAKKTDIKGVRVSPHTFRHTFSKMFLENGGDIYKLSLLLGHSSVVVTENYLKDFESRVARQGQIQHSPVANMKLAKQKGGFRKIKKDFLEDQLS
ncbi:tyrosine recombinase XerD [Dictyobacter vulcani]|uniref:Tyrosine recombinase XerD n=1 Tax=Dictyobacter vulcani TaxID=2607529 RepID=A0A5J4KF93_9CHLR|nr:tyrosine-type recombinase/integrase [Dictyobacter vulcani]GER88064.1 tyrosine recombinase XerD [Dictyobacter vulcani]